MNLHRTTGRPDWADSDERTYNSWQKLAVATGGVVTPGNLVTLLGLALVVTGLVMIIGRAYIAASGLIIIGRLLDLVDGWLAEKTKTKSPLGEFMDAGADKVETFAALIVMYLATLAPWWLLTLLLLPHIGITILSLMARARHIELHPSRLGKICMAMLWVSLFGLLALRVMERGGVLMIVIYAVAAVTILMTIGALIDYGRQLRAK